MRTNRLLALGATAALALGGAAIATPALAVERPVEPSVEQLVETQVEQPAERHTETQAAPQAAPEYADIVIDGFGDGPDFRDGPLAGLSGTGEPGATVRGSYVLLTDPAAPLPDFQRFETRVGADGAWSYGFPEPLRRGLLLAAVDQQAEDETRLGSDTAAAMFVDPAQITSITRQSYSVDTAPSGAAGTVDPLLFAGFFGETGPVTLLSEGAAAAVAGDASSDQDPEDSARQNLEQALDAAAARAEDAPASHFAPTLTSSTGAEYPVDLAADGSWTADFGGRLPLGDYTLTLAPAFSDPFFEAMNRMRPESVEFSVAERGGGNGGSDDEGDEGENGGGSGQGKSGQGSERPAAAAKSGAELARTGTAGVLPSTLGAAGLFLAGAAALLASRRRARA